MDFFSTLLCILAVVDHFCYQDKLNEGAGQKGITFWNPLHWRGLFPSMGIGSIFFAWFLISALGFLINSSPEAPWIFRLVIFKWILMLYVFIYAFERIPFPEKILPWAGLIFFVSNVFSLWTFFTRYDFFRGIYLDIALSEHRLGGFFFDPMTYGHSYAMGFFMLLWATFFMTSKMPRWAVYFCWLNVFLLGVTLLLTFTRGVWFGIFWGLLISAFLFHRRIGVWVSILLLLIFGALFASWPPFQERVLHVFHADQNYDSQRLTLWKANWEIFKDYPLLGIGYDENSRRLREYYDQMGVPEGFFEGHAHNQFLHLLAGTGLLGLACYLLIIGFFMRESWRAYKVEKDPWWKGLMMGALAAQISFHLGAMTEANFEHSKVRFIMMILWTLIVVRRRYQSVHSHSIDVK